jgi:phenylalanyl-tRNA synthetase beta chain
LATALAANQRRQQSRVRLFEVGRKFVVNDTGVLQEIPIVAGIAAGAALAEQWGAPKTAVDFFDVKADVESILRATGASQEFRFETGLHAALHPGQTARVIRTNGQPAGWIGRLHPEIERALDLTYSGVVFELEVGPALAARVPQFEDVSRFPAVRRDLALLVAEPVTVQNLLDRIQETAGALLRDAVVFDIYRGAGIETGRKSVAIGLNLQDVSRTLTDEETDAVVARVVADLERECGATIRR